MGEARRRVDQGLPPRNPRLKKNKKNDSPRIVPWLPFTEQQKEQFYAITIRGGWIGIGLVIFIWLVARVIGPAAGWWVPADLR